MKRVRKNLGGQGARRDLKAFGKDCEGQKGEDVLVVLSCLGLKDLIGSA